MAEVNVLTATVLPENVTQPITYTWQASGQLSIPHAAGVSDTLTVSWDAPGLHQLMITELQIT